MQKLVVVGCTCLVVGLLIGWYAGRFMQERYWTQPLVLKRLAAADVERSSGAGADPVPAVGSVVLRPTPLERARRVIAEITRRDPLVVTLADVGNGKTGSQLNLELENRGKCPVSSYSGVAYGYDAYGRPRPMNKGGEHYVAFSEADVHDLAPTAQHSLSMALHHTDTASLVVAHVDRVICADGSRWTRQ